MASKSNRKKSATTRSKLRIETLIHEDATRKNIPTAEFESVIQSEDQKPKDVRYERRNRDLDPQFVWRGKDVQDWSDLVVSTPPLYIQEKVHPKAIIDDLMKKKSKGELPEQADLFSDFNGLPSEEAKTEFYQHDAHWSNRMILGDSLQVMASLAERESLRGKVQCIYFDPPYGIKFNSNFQWSTTSRDVKDGKADHITREPEQVKAFRDTWRDGIHSYLTYLRDRLTVARDLLSDNGSIFVQIGDENIHRVRAVMDEIFGEDNFCSEIVFRKTAKTSTNLLPSENDYLLWYSKRKESAKFRQLYKKKNLSELKSYKYLVSAYGNEARGASLREKEDPSTIPSGWRLCQMSFVVSGDPGKPEDRYYNFCGKEYDCGSHRHWKTSNPSGLDRLKYSQRLFGLGSQLNYIRYFDDFSVESFTSQWTDTGSAGFSNSDPKIYVVQTDSEVIQRCILMTTDPGDLILDPTCGSGTTAYVAEQWGRRWITVDTSRVALALARSRIMGAKYPYYILRDSKLGQNKIAEISRTVPPSEPVFGNVRHGFVYERVPHITLKSIANNAEIDVIWEKWKPIFDDLVNAFNKATKQKLNDWEIPNQCDEKWDSKTKEIHQSLMKVKNDRQKEMDSSIAAKADFEELYDRPYADKSRVRVAGPFTIESVSPHRSLVLDENDSIIEDCSEIPDEMAGARDFTSTILDNLRTSGVQQAHKSDKISFTTIQPWPGNMICADGRYEDKVGKEKRAAILVGPEFGTVTRPDLVAAAKEAAESDFEVLIACAFNFDARATEFSSLGKIPILKARMNADLHMAEDLKNTGKGNLFVVFGEPDIEIKHVKDQYKVKIKGVDVFHPNTGEVRSDGADGIACWMIDTDYNEESFFVRHAYFLGANDPYKALKSSLKAEIEESAWASLHSDTSRPFDKPDSGRIAVKVINHLGDEVMKVFKI